MKLPIQSAPVSRYLRPEIAWVKSDGINPNNNGDNLPNRHAPGGIYDISQKISNAMLKNNEQLFQQAMRDAVQNAAYAAQMQSKLSSGPYQIVSRVLKAITPGPKGSQIGGLGDMIIGAYKTTAYQKNT